MNRILAIIFGKVLIFITGVIALISFVSDSVPNNYGVVALFLLFTVTAGTTFIARSK